MTQLPTDMLAIEITAPGGPEMLRPCRRPVPVPAPGQVLIRVAVAGVNRPDALQRAGSYRPPPDATDLPGLEVAGHIAALELGVAGWAVGDRVCALTHGGGYAEYAAVDGDTVLPIPEGITPLQAALLPEAVFTVWSNMFDRGGLQPGETVLVHGGASGIGTTAIQMARAWGARVIVTASGGDRCARCVALGADLAIDYQTQDFVALALAATGGRGVDLVLDMVGGDYVPRNLKAMAEDGRHVSIGVQAAATTQINLFSVMARRLTLTGSTLRPRTPAVKAAIAQAVRATVWPWVADGRLRPVIAATYPMRDAEAAHRLMETGGHFGKIALVVEGA